MSRPTTTLPAPEEAALAVLAWWWERRRSPSVEDMAGALGWPRARTSRVVVRLVRARLVRQVARTGLLLPGQRWEPPMVVEAGSEAGSVRLLLALAVFLVIVAVVAAAVHPVPLVAAVILAGAVVGSHHNRRRRHGRRLRHPWADAGLVSAAWWAWQRHHQRHPTPAPPASSVAVGDRFEHYVAEVLGDAGWRLAITGAHVTRGAGDGGVDLAGHCPDGRSVVVQAKAGAGSVGAGVVRDLLGARSLAGADLAVLATTRVLTPAAAAAARAGDVVVLDGPALAGMARRPNRRPVPLPLNVGGR